MANVTYLLGAGASYNALPVVDEFAEVLSKTITELEYIARNKTYGYIFDDDSPLDITYENAISDLKVLLEGCHNHLSVDTFAKMLFLTDNPLYETVKKSISLFFELFPIMYKVYGNNGYKTEMSKVRHFDRIDKRYDAFLASIIQGTYDKLPRNIKIITYNYDHQFTLAYNRYLNSANSHLSIDSLLNCYTCNESYRSYDMQGFSINKINGAAGFLNSNKILQSLESTTTLHSEIKDIIIKYNEMRNRSYKSSISFAWETDLDNNQFIDNVKQATKTSDILVVIGYSFPFFNRKTDHYLFGVDSMHDLKKIYVQDKNAEEVIERIKSVRPYGLDMNLKYTPIYNTHQFYLPPELSF